MPPQESQYVFIDVYRPGHKRSDLCEIQIHSKVNEVEQLEQLRSWWGDPRACVWEHLSRPGLWQLQCHCHHWDCSSAWLPRLAESPGQGEHHTARETHSHKVKRMHMLSKYPLLHYQAAATHTTHNSQTGSSQTFTLSFNSPAQRGGRANGGMSA